MFLREFFALVLPILFTQKKFTQSIFFKENEKITMNLVKMNIHSNYLAPVNAILNIYITHDYKEKFSFFISN